MLGDACSAEAVRGTPRAAELGAIDKDELVAKDAEKGAATGIGTDSMEIAWPVADSDGNPLADCFLPPMIAEEFAGKRCGASGACGSSIGADKWPRAPRMRSAIDSALSGGAGGMAATAAARSSAWRAKGNAAAAAESAPADDADSNAAPGPDGPCE